MTRKTSHMEGAEPILERLLSELRFRQAEKYVKRGDVIADMGCGFRGNFLTRVTDKIRVGIGYDVSVKTNIANKNIELKKADLNGKIDSKRNFFDLVTALAVLEHVTNPKTFLNKINKMLKKNGRIVITTPHMNSKFVLETLASLGLISKEEILDHKNYFDKKSLENLLGNTGFEKVKVETFELGLNLIAVAQKTT